MSLGYGPTRVSARCHGGLDLCRESDGSTPTTVALFIGGMVSPRLGIGGDFLLWRHTGANETQLGLLKLAAIYFLPLDTGLYVKAGAGIARAENQISQGQLTATGPGVSAGLGWDLSLHRKVALTFELSRSETWPGGLTNRIGETLDRGWRFGFWAFGVSLVLR